MHRFFATFFVLCLCRLAVADIAESTRPHIVLIYAEDMSPELGCYGHPAVRTPKIDSLAAHGVRYTRLFCTGPSCTPSRNAMITGVYQTRTGTQDQRRGGVVLPAGVQPITEPLRRAGYYCAVGCGYNAKTDFNFVAEQVFDGDDWSLRADGQPFFAQITLGITHRHPGVGWSKIRAAAESPVDPQAVELPPYFPDTPECRLDWAGYLDSIEAMDAQVGQILDRLDQEGLAESTVVIFMGDNGRCHLRGKCWLYEGGLHVPLIIRRPGGIGKGLVEEGLYSAIDVTATILSLAGADPPPVFDGVPLLGEAAKPREAIFAARDLIDEVRDTIRCVRTDRWRRR
ncbi:sulfatase family protein [Botrimarina hoheduenensis]|uniref:Sulfatase n=1 Tax=Botrimarina hoheduenensis TaxID=2528000 RepID=A0A5C5VQ02_9BACT|nr:sulfatase [Botrimarina hoheduenensis]TWT40227.1 Sulfatase [Botrimarina hoheduenensis]